MNKKELLGDLTKKPWVNTLVTEPEIDKQKIEKGRGDAYRSKYA